MIYKPIIIGIDPGYPRRQELKFQIEAVRDEIRTTLTIAEDFDIFCARINGWASSGVFSE
tara:strand:- start:1866 stop:2045 length:180 start_codon:yes stop_codon:yes gene_type:complete